MFNFPLTAFKFSKTSIDFQKFAFENGLHTKLVRQSQIVQGAINSYSTVVPKVLMPARFTPVCIYLGYVLRLCFHSRSKTYVQLLFFTTSFRF